VKSYSEVQTVTKSGQGAPQDIKAEAPFQMMGALPEIVVGVTSLSIASSGALKSDRAKVAFSQS
jgi:hypothetical protein